MHILTKIIFISLICSNVLSCTPSAPYEIKSPCVSIEATDHPYAITPCVRRPVNLEHAIT